MIMLHQLMFDVLFLYKLLANYDHILIVVIVSINVGLLGLKAMPELRERIYMDFPCLSLDERHF